MKCKVVLPWWGSATAHTCTRPHHTSVRAYRVPVHDDVLGVHLKVHRDGRRDASRGSRDLPCLPLRLPPRLLRLLRGGGRRRRGGEGGPADGLHHEAERGGVGHDGVDAADEAEGVGDLLGVGGWGVIGGWVGR